MGIDVDGQVLAWGWNGRGTLGRGHREAKGAERPQRVLGLEGRRIVQVALGGWHCLALDARGQVYAWGGNEYGQCGLEEGLKDVVTARPCLQGMRFRRIAAGGMHSLALTDSGEVCVHGWFWRWEGGAACGHVLEGLGENPCTMLSTLKAKSSRRR